MWSFPAHTFEETNQAHKNLHTFAEVNQKELGDLLGPFQPKPFWFYDQDT